MHNIPHNPLPTLPYPVPLPFFLITISFIQHSTHAFLHEHNVTAVISKKTNMPLNKQNLKLGLNRSLNSVFKN